MDQVGSDGENLGKVRRKKVGVGDNFQGGGQGGSSLWVGDMGDYPPNKLGLGDFQNRVARHIIEWKPRRLPYGSW